MILPLIENAFKHKSHFKNPQDNKIHINIYKSNNTTLNIIVKNTYEELYEGKTLNKNPHGVPSNLKRRLELWSDNRYALKTYIKDGFYNSKLTLSVCGVKTYQLVVDFVKNTRCYTCFCGSSFI
jgi:LytS/YehU family sensor histidine kinase